MTVPNHGVEDLVNGLLDRGFVEEELTGVAHESRAEAADRRRRVMVPAQGERNAVVGYLGQYEFASARTLAALRDGRLESVRLADLEAGQIDDFQIRSAERVDAHQVKWSLHPGTAGFAEFLNDGTNRTRYIRQLAEGWRRLASLHAPRPVVVHFVTNDVPSISNNPSIPRPDAEVHDRHGAESARGASHAWSLAAFLAEAWRPAVEAARANEDPSRVVPARWGPAMEALRRASGLGGDDWPRFVADCELEFGVPSLAALLATAPVSDAERRVLRDDANKLAQTFVRLVARPDRRVEFSRDELLDHLGWRHRVEFRNTHEFPDPEIPYRSITATAREVTEALDRLAGGYVALVGSPGSGKSTLLTQTLRGSAHRIVRYYAYVPHAAGANLRRGEAVNFLHDLTMTLSRAGIQSGAALPIENLDLLAHRFNDQLQQLHREWLEEGRRTVILVDGLDHIPREQSPEHSLLGELPPPEAVPDGVLFLLGTQTEILAGLSPRIRAQINETGRRITMCALEREDVVEIVHSAADLDPAPTAEECERIYDLSAGHPLALNYIINRLRHARRELVDQVLDAVAPFAETIDVQYATIWAQVEGNVELARLLALFARARGPVRLAWARRWAQPQALHDLTGRFAHYFRQERGPRLAFFHNSFRAFLIEHTRALPAVGDDAELFAELAERCAAAGAGEPERADELYYRAHAGDRARVLALGDPSVFRAQFVTGRPVTAILDDILLLLEVAVAERDVVALTRAVLARAEFAQREYYVGQLPLAETRLELGDAEMALDELRDDGELRTSPELALSAAAALDASGLPEEARKVFALAEPLEVLRGASGRAEGGREDGDVLEAWVTAAPRFRSVESIIVMIGQVRAVARPVGHPDGDDAAADLSATARRRSRLLQSLAGSLDALDRWEEADAVRNDLRSRGDSALAWWFWAQASAWQDAHAAGQATQAADRFRILREAVETGTVPNSTLGSAARVALARGYLLVDGDADAARRALDGVDQPSPVTDESFERGEGFSPYRARFELNRVLGALGDQRPFSEIVPDAPMNGARRGPTREEGAAFLTQFERGVVALGRLGGLAWAGRDLSHPEFETLARPLLRLFPEHPHFMHGSHHAFQARREFYGILIRVAASHGEACVGVLRRLLDAEWSDESRRRAWPDAVIRSMVSELIEAGAPLEWGRAWLECVEPMTFRGEDLETELGEGIEQARAWTAAGDVTAARQTLERVLRATYGSHPKDSQLVPWVAWAVRANRADPAGTPERFGQMATAVASLEGSESMDYVATKLLAAGVTAGARSACALLEWALRNNVRGWVDGLTILLDGLAIHAPGAAGTISAFYRNLVLPFESSAKVDAVAHIGAALRRVGDAGEQAALAEAIEVVALGSTRAPLREALAGGAEEARESLRDGSTSDPTAPGQVVDAFEGLSLTVRELRERVRSVGDVADLVRRLKPNAYLYRWETILEPLIGSAGVDELVEVAEQLPTNGHEWQALAAIADRLITLGDARASEVVRRLLLISRPTGWWPWYDGGSRLRAYELLVRLSPEAGRRDAWEALRGDLLAGQVRSADLFDVWERIVALLSPDASDVKVWNVISRHVAVLVAHAPQAERLELPAPEDPGDAEAAAEVVTGIASDYLDHPAYALAQGAQRFFVDQLLRGDPAAEAVLTTRLRDSDALKGGALLALRAVARKRGVVPPAVHDALRALCRAPSYRDRRAVDELLGTEAPGAELVRVHQMLPAVLRLVHPPAPQPRRRVLPRRGEMLPPPDGPAEIVGLFRPELDMIAGMAGVQPEALYRYVADLAGGAGGHDGSLDDEPELRDQMRALGLEITYRRPRPLRVERAMSEAVAMLFDRGRLDATHLSMLDRILRPGDPYFLVRRPVRRPAPVPFILERMASRHEDDGWTAAVSTRDAATGRAMDDRSGGATGNGWIVLAEETWTRWLNWSCATETRVGARLEIGSCSPPDADGVDEVGEDAHGSMAAGAVLDRRVAAFKHLLQSEYVTHARASGSIVVRNDAFRFETPARGWLALNPTLAEHLGWRLDPEGLFRWVDESGRVVAESVWWEDGFAQHRPPLFDDEVGQGWLVRASIEGWRRIAAAVGATVDWCRISRLALEQPCMKAEDWRPASER